MAFQDPFAAYNASSNTEAHFVCGRLLEADIEAMVVEDVSQAGVWLGGTVSEIHKPQVWIERSDIERARPVLEDYEQRARARRAAAQSPVKATGTTIAVLCEECGKRSEFPDTQKGLVASCPHCGGYVDVGDDEEFEGWEESPETNDEEI